MKKGIFWVTLSGLIVISLILASCSSSTTTTTNTTNTTSTTTTSAIVTSTVSTSPTTTLTSSSTTTSVVASTTSTGNWWDSLGTPQYGGSETVSINTDATQWDPYSIGGTNVLGMYLEQMDMDNWTINPSNFAFEIIFRPPQDVVGCLATGWTMPDVNDFVVTLRQNIYWQNIAPVNGRQFTAADVVWNMDRIYGLGGGFTTPDPNDPSDVSSRAAMTSVMATGPFTVDFHWSSGNVENILETQLDQGTAVQDYVAPEAVQQWGNLNDWHHAMGTGPFILTDFVDSSSATFVNNPNYWGVDERYPQNRLPYVSKVTILIIPNQSTALAALRSGKIDIVPGNNITAANGLKATNPDIVQVPVLQAAEGMSMDNAVAPFNNLQVREALQLAMNLPLICSTYYDGSVAPIPQTLTLSTMGGGWGDPYPDWPASVQAQYAYNPTLAEQLLAQAGYPNGFTTTCVVNNSSDLELLQIVVSELAAINVNVNLTLMDNADWGSYVIGNKKATALTYCDGRPLGNAYSPIRQLELFMYGYGADYGFVNDPAFNAAYPAALAATDVSQMQQIVANANLEVAQQHFALSIVSPNLYAFVQPWLKGYAGQNASASGGASYSGFYMARYWIDQSAK